MEFDLNPKNQDELLESNICLIEQNLKTLLDEPTDYPIPSPVTRRNHKNHENNIETESSDCSSEDSNYYSLDSGSINQEFCSLNQNPRQHSLPETIATVAKQTTSLPSGPVHPTFYHFLSVAELQAEVNRKILEVRRRRSVYGHCSIKDKGFFNILKAVLKMRNLRFCTFCFNNLELFEVFSTHYATASNGRAICPNLRSKPCQICGASDLLAHTYKYCPYNPQNVKYRRFF